MARNEPNKVFVIKLTKESTLLSPEKHCIGYGYKCFDGGTKCESIIIPRPDRISPLLLNSALEEEVIITRRDGSKFKLISMNKNKGESISPLENIKGIKTSITMDEILEAIKRGREDREYN